MITGILAAELIRLGVNGLKHVKLEDVERLSRALGIAKPAALLAPTLGLVGVGVAIGAGIGLLAAPQSGRELRDRALQFIRNTSRGNAGQQVQVGDTRAAGRPAAAGISS